MSEPKDCLECLWIARSYFKLQPTVLGNDTYLSVRVVGEFSSSLFFISIHPSSSLFCNLFPLQFFTSIICPCDLVVVCIFTLAQKQQYMNPKIYSIPFSFRPTLTLRQRIVRSVKWREQMISTMTLSWSLRTTTATSTNRAIPSLLLLSQTIPCLSAL